MGYLEYAVVVRSCPESTARGASPWRPTTACCSNHIYAMGDERQKQAYLVPLASGKAIGAWGLTEPGPAVTRVSLLTHARRKLALTS